MECVGPAYPAPPPCNASRHCHTNSAAHRGAAQGARLCPCCACLTSHTGLPLEAPQTVCKRAAQRRLLMPRPRAPVTQKLPSHEQQQPSNPSPARYPLLLLLLPLHRHCHHSPCCFHLCCQARCSLPTPPPDSPSGQALPKLPWRRGTGQGLPAPCCCRRRALTREPRQCIASTMSSATARRQW